jgi:UDP-N-acetylmuramyl pentapeptide phosphotransferase/UDP-N-acetylglucosamine-1-phosphate transferase
MVLTGVLIAGVALVVAWGVTRALVPLLRQRGVLDVPNERSSHEQPTPRGGGLGILAGVAVSAGVAGVMGLPLPGGSFWGGAAIIAAVGLVDDRTGGLSALVRFGLQGVAAAVVLVGAGGGIAHLPFPPPLDPPVDWLGVPLALLWLVAVTNFYNFLDGIDGFAGLQGMIAGVALAVLSTSSPIFAVGLGIAGGCLGFLLYNWHPARIFMGDVGSATLGFMFAALPFQMPGPLREEALFVVAMVLWFFLADGAYTLLRRALRGERVWEPHRSHLYQRLLKTGLRHDQVALRVNVAASALAACAVAVWHYGRAAGQWGALALALVAAFVYLGVVRWRESALDMQASQEEAQR